MELEEGVLVIKRIHVFFHLKAPEAARPTIERVHGIFAPKCPVYRSIRAAIRVTTSFELVGGDPEPVTAA
jgi:uncharacterized OsmC-like protein